MDQHPVPRNITGFQFQLIGFMTLKQFSYLIVGFIFAFIFYKAPISIFSIPLAALSLFVGFAFAFLPIQERPLEVWVKNFIKSMYSPTQYFWQREVNVPDYLKFSAFSGAALTKKKNEAISTHVDAKEKLERYLQSTRKMQNTLDVRETQFLKNIGFVLTTPASVKVQTTPRNPAPNLLPKGIVAGIVRFNNQPLPNILINIKKQNGEPVRILKSDSFGRFGTKIPLAPGFYEAQAEDPSKTYTFHSFKFSVNETGLAPYLITPIT